MTQSVGFHRGSRTNSRVGLGLNNYSPTHLNWGGGGGWERQVVLVIKCVLRACTCRHVYYSPGFLVNDCDLKKKILSDLHWSPSCVQSSNRPFASVNVACSAGHVLALDQRQSPSILSKKLAVSARGAGIAQWLEHRTRDWKVAGSNPCWNGGRIFFSRVNFLCWLLFRYPFHPRVTAVARKRPRSFCQKCRWQVTAKHAYTLRMWILLNRASALVTTCP